MLLLDAATARAPGEEPLPLLPPAPAPTSPSLAAIIIGENVVRTHASLPRTADASALASRGGL